MTQGFEYIRLGTYKNKLNVSVLAMF